MWPIVNTPRWRGKNQSLPQVLLADPDWFFWAYETNPAMFSRLPELYAKARAIKIPQTAPGKTLIAEYLIHPPTGKFAKLQVLASSIPQHQGSSPAYRKLVLDLGFAREISKYDKLGGRTLVDAVKRQIFPGKKRITRLMVEAFFDDDRNFQL